MLRIGLVDGAPEYLFDGIKAITRLSDGTIVVLNSGDSQLRYYSADGTHIRSVSRAGHGPGEMRAPRWMQRLPGDVLQVTHSDGRTRFLPDGTMHADDRMNWGDIHRISSASRLPNSAGFLMESCGLPTPVFLDDSVLLCASTYTDVRFLPDTPGLHESVSLVARADWSLESLDTIGIFRKGAMMRYPAQGRLHSARFGPPFGPRGRMRVTGTPARLVYEDALSYRIEIHGNDGSGLQMVVQRAGGLRIPTENEKQSFDRAFARDDRMRRPGGSASEFRHLVEAADSVSIIGMAPYIDAGNALWVPLGASFEDAHRIFDVFDAEGIYLGQVRIPRYGIRVLDIGEDYMLGVDTDDLGVEYVVMHRLTR